MRTAQCHRKTLETDIQVSVNIDGTGLSEISTGIGFMDHMLTLLAFHSKMDLTIQCVGDLTVDGHHTIEDVGLLLGSALKEALGDRIGIERYGSCFLPMDETLSRVVLDISNRPLLVYNVGFERFDLGSLDVQNIKEFFKSISQTLGMTLHLEVLYGENDHHKAEALFKGFGRAFKEAVKITGTGISSSKGVL